MTAQIVKKNKMSVRGNVAYIFDGLVLFRLENKGDGDILFERAVVLPEDQGVINSEEVTITKELVDSLIWDKTDIGGIMPKTFMKIENKFFKFCNK